VVHSASARGDLHPISVTTQQIRVCMCGQPVKPNIGGVRGGRVGNMDQNAFMESLDAALKSRSAIPEMIAALVTENVTRSEFEASEARLSALGSWKWSGAARGSPDRRTGSQSRRSSGTVEP
jgi:hypothetical protein